MQNISTDKSLLAEHLAAPRHVGIVTSGARGRGVVENAATGDAVHVSVRVEDGRICEARQRSFGNPVLGAVASFVADCITGQEIATAADIRAEDVARTMRIPSPHGYVVPMVMVAMLSAFQDYRRKHGSLYGGMQS